MASYLIYSAGHFRKTYYADFQDVSYIFFGYPSYERFAVIA